MLIHLLSLTLDCKNADLTAKGTPRHLELTPMATTELRGSAQALYGDRRWVLVPLGDHCEYHGF